MRKNTEEHKNFALFQYRLHKPYTARETPLLGMGNMHCKGHVH